jgi:hypothetical protein
MVEFLCATWLKTIGKGPNGARFRALNWIALIAFGISIILIILDFHYGANRGWIYVIAFFLLVCTFIGPVSRVAVDERDRALTVVVFWAAVGLVAFVVTFVAAYSAFTGANATNYDRLLNIVPAVVAVWGAGIGWYVQHQVAIKSHRTTHAFNVIMQTRTSSEYLRNLRAFQLEHPAGVPMAGTDTALFSTSIVSQLPLLQEQLETETDANNRHTIAAKIRKVEACLAAKYLLNYFEFMARAIKSGDLDDDLIYGTIGSTVIGIHQRTAAFRNHCQPNQPLAMQFLDPLIASWELRKRVETAQFPRRT